MSEVDLHMHSTCSDGTMKPEELVELAEKKGLKAISITDHDTICHVKEVLAAAKDKSVEVIPGIEVSADFSGGTMHILGYFINPDDEGLYEMLRNFRSGREERNPKIIEKLNQLGVDISYAEVLKVAGSSIVGRPHIARVLIEKGYAKNHREAFDLYLAKGAKAYCDRVRAEAKTIIGKIHGAGGVAVLAHPKQLNAPNSEALETIVVELIEYGLDGIEVYSSCQNKKESAEYLKVAEKLNLIVTGGSDFHGGNKTNITMGTLGKGVELGYSVVEEMKARLK